jgi:hypothetical protein
LPVIVFFCNFIGMKYLVEINPDSEKGSELIKYIERLDADEDDIHILNEPPLTDEEMGLPPTRKVSLATMEAWLKPEDDEESFTIEEVRNMIKNDRKGKK